MLVWIEEEESNLITEHTKHVTLKQSYLHMSNVSRRVMRDNNREHTADADIEFRPQSRMAETDELNKHSRLQACVIK